MAGSRILSGTEFGKAWADSFLISRLAESAEPLKLYIYIPNGKGVWKGLDGTGWPGGLAESAEPLLKLAS